MLRTFFLTVAVTTLLNSSQNVAAETVGETQDTWRANPEVVAKASKRAGFNFDESKVVDYTLPDPLVALDGTPVTRDTWPARRGEIFELFETHVYGRPPAGRPQNLEFKTIEEDPRDLDGRATRKLIEISFDTPHAGRQKFQVQLYIPNGAPKPVPAVVLLQFRSLTDPATPLVIERGFALAIVDRTPVAADDAKTYRDGVINAFHGDGPLAPDDGHAIAAWAWAASRVLDYLQTDPAIDDERVGVAGHSRMGKTALWAGAADPRFAIVLSNESGAGGAALSRRNFGETVRQLNTAFPQWYCDNFRRYDDREAELPIDQHMLIALIAPRPVYVTSADEDLWADPRGEFLSCVHADPVYTLLGIRGLERPPFGSVEAQGETSFLMPPLEHPLTNGRIGYHIRRGRHGFTAYDWLRFLDFATKHLPTPTN